MTRWEKELSEHPFFTLLDEVDAKLDVALKKYPDNMDACGELLRTKSVLSFAKESMQNWIPELAPIMHISGMQVQLQKAVPPLDSYIANGNIGHLYAANQPTNSNTVNTYINHVHNTAMAYGGMSPIN